MLTGLPIICIEGDATGRAVGQVAGITVPLSPDIPPIEGLAQAIAALDSGEERRQALAREAQKMALDLYSYEALVRRVEDIYNHLIKGTS